MKILNILRGKLLGKKQLLINLPSLFLYITGIKRKIVFRFIGDGNGKIDINGNITSYNYKGRIIKFHTKDLTQLSNTIQLIHAQFMRGDYNKFDVKGRDVLDIGANIGDTSILFVLQGAKHVYAFEPYPYTFSFLEKNVELNGMPKKITLENVAVGPKNTSIILDSKFKATGSTSLKPSEEGIKIKIMTLDKIVKKTKIRNGALKIDVQGYERNVIMGSMNILSRIKVIIIETSFHELYEGQPLFSDIYLLLNQQGFVYSGSFGELSNPLDGAPLQQDSIFIRSQANTHKE
jgi:FkbM family methyltransferase